MRTPKILIWGGFAVTMAIGRGASSPSDVAIRGVGETQDAARFTFQVTLPGVEESGDPGSATIRVPGFDARLQLPGAPDLPTKTVLVAIPDGVTPALEVRAGPDSVRPGVIPRGAAQRFVERVVEGPGSPRAEASVLVMERTDEVSVREERLQDPAVFTGEEVYPGAIARLGKTGAFRGQRYVEVQLTPVRFDPRIRGLRICPSFEVTVRFEGDAGVRREPRPDPFLEDVYRSTFLNYAQGTTFRLDERSALSFSGAGTKTSAALAASPIQRIRVRQNGIVRLDSSAIAATPFAAEDVATWKLTSRGVEVPLDIHDDGDGILGPGEWVQFYGQALDDEPKAVLNTDMPSSEDLYEARDFSDENVYFLTVDPGPRARMADRPSAPTNIRTPPADFEAVAHAETDSAWRPLAANDPWYWSPTMCASGCSPTSRTDSVSLPGLRQGTLPLRVLVKVRGSSEDAAIFPDHRTRVTLLNSLSQVLATNDDNGTFDGRTLYTHDFTWSYPGAGAEATDPVSVRLELLSSGTTNQAILDWIDVRYRRSFSVSGDRLTFDWPDQDAEFVVDGLSGSAPAVYEVTQHVASSGIVDPVRLVGVSASGAGPYSVRFRVDKNPLLADGTSRRFVVAGDAGVSIPGGADFTADTVSDLRDTANQADLIVIAHPTVLDLSPSSPLSLLLERRALQGIRSTVARIEDVQDDFNDGLAGPLAIKRFLQWVMSTNPGEGWASPKPSFVLILGDGSYNYKGGTAAGNFVPTQIFLKDDPQLGYYASDNVLADVDGDQIADLMVGRISVRTAAEANLVLQKVLDYEQNPPAGNWRKHALFVSDRGKSYNAEEALDFESMNDTAESFMKRPPHTTRKLRYWTDFCGGTCPYPSAANAIRAAIKSAVNGTDGFSDGAAIVQYSGHGNFDWWSDDAIFDDFVTPKDTSFLVNGNRLPWLMVHTCLTAGFHTTVDRSMGEDWLKRSGGGAVAMFGNSGLGANYIGREVIGVVWNDLFGPRKVRTVAVPVLDTLAALCLQGSIEPCQNYTFLGDPTLNLVLPGVGAPGQLQAAPGNARVDLSWTASSTPGATYDLYRATQLVPANYTKLNAAPISGTLYADTTALNTTTYYYYAVAVDSQGFESRWSNFNSDCAVSGPDCVRATPLNPNAPGAPTGVAVVDTEKGGSLRVTWNANPETDLRGYTVYVGSASGTYSASFDAGRGTAYGLVGLANGTRYYVAVTATNTSSKTSAFSIEASGIPSSVQGLKPPAFIQSLRVNRSGASAVLTWGAVTTDIYGKPETVAHYEVYRGTTPDFVPSVANRIGTPSMPSFTDTNALNAPTPYFYLVRALDSEGNAGGLGSDLPNGILLLTVGPGQGNPTDLILSWPAVTTTFSGARTQVVRYDIYAAAQPFTRAQIRDGLVPLLASTSSGPYEYTPPLPNQYYSVLAVDARGNVSPF